MPTYDEIVSPITGFFGITPESVLAGKGKGPNQTKATWVDKALGVNSEELKGAKKAEDEYNLTDKYKAQYEEATGKPFNVKLGEGGILRAIKKAGKKEGISDAITQAETLHNLPSAVRQRDVEDRRWNETQRLNLMDRADAREAKAAELEYMKMRDRKEDRRYNESIERMDRKDRQQSIQTLVAGLANLGAAFAL